MLTPTMVRVTRTALLAAAMVMLAGGTAHATAHALHAEKYAPQSAPEISGWNWLRNQKAVATFEFETDKLAGCNTDRVHINFAGLATNGVDGGAGYDAKMTLTVTVGKDETQVKLWAQNGFAPRSPEHSKGLGYACQGFSEALPDKVVERAIKSGKLIITLEWKNVMHEHHVGVNKASIFLGYVKGEKPAAEKAKDTR